MSISQDNYVSRQIISFFRRNTGPYDGYNETGINIGGTGLFVNGRDGKMGDTGPTGKDGKEGKMGLMGDTGPPGKDGEMGLMGDTGPTGKEGKMGLMGDTGPPGKDGEMGLMGDTGPTGKEGKMGLMGDTGPTGAFSGIVYQSIIPGSTGISLGSTGSPFSNLYLSPSTIYMGNASISATGTTIVLPANSTVGGSLIATVGMMGLMGDTGPPGKDGEMGLMGDTGPTGGSPWILQDNNAYFTSGNIGIGTSKPSALLTLSSDNSGIILMNGAQQQSRSITSGMVSNEIMGLSSSSSDMGQLRLSAGGAITKAEKTYIDMYGYDQRYIAFGTVGTEQMRIESNGFIGVGVTQPKCRLHLASSSSTVYADSYASIANEGFVTGSDPLDFQNTTIYTDGGIVCNGRVASIVFNSFSDRRIKKNVIPFNRDAIDIVNRIEIVSYDHIDSKKKSIGAGVIAQDVEQVFPECITKNNEIVPNIYAMCHHSENNNENVDIFVACNDDILLAKRVSLKIGRRKENCEIEIITDIISVVFDKGYIMTVSKWKNYMNTDEVFVYGTDVSDFRMVDKEMISMVSVKAIQQLSRENQELKSSLSLQEKRIARLEELFKNL
jgi:Chaperone of endosialidase/Collagen triple helix repeat (20 copies)